MEHEIMEIWDWENARVPFYKFLQKQVFKMPTPGAPNSRKKTWVSKIEQLPKSKSGQTAILMFVWHKWEDGSRKVNMNAVNFSPTPWNFGPVMSQAVRKHCFSTSIPRGQNPRFPDGAGAGAGQTLRSQADPSPNVPRDEINPQGKPSLLILWHWSSLPVSVFEWMTQKY